MKPPILKGLKFIISGGLAALSKLLLFILLFSFLHIYYLLSSVVAFLLSLIVAFYLQKYFTFEDDSQHSMKKQASIFLFVSLLNLLVNIMVMYIFVDIWNFNEIFAQIITLGILACWNFFVYQKFIFNDKIVLWKQ